MNNALERMSQKEFCDILTAIFGGISKSDKSTEEQIPWLMDIADLKTPGIFDNTDEVKAHEEGEERDLLGELTASFILDGLDVTRKDTLMMVLFDNRTRVANGEKLTHRIVLTHKCT